MPERLTLATHDHRRDHAAWLAQLTGAQVRDIYPIQVAELATVRLPGGSPRRGTRSWQSTKRGNPGSGATTLG